jgi:hypothetical protein
MRTTDLKGRVMKVGRSADKPTDASMLVNVPRLVAAYYTEAPDL